MVWQMLTSKQPMSIGMAVAKEDIETLILIPVTNR